MQVVVHTVQVCTKCTDIVCQHRGHNKLDRHRDTDCEWIGQTTPRIQRASSFLPMDVSQLWRSCPNNCRSNQRISLPHPYWSTPQLVRIRLFLFKGESIGDTSHVTGEGHEEVGWWACLETRGSGTGTARKKISQKASSQEDDCSCWLGGVEGLVLLLTLMEGLWVCSYKN